MPHIFVEDFKEFKGELQRDGVKFGFCSSDIEQKDHYLISAKYKDREFFLEVKRKDKGFIIKSEKYTRPSPNYPLHRAIDSLSKELNLKVLSSNLNLKESEHIQYRDRLRELNYFMSEYSYSRETWIEIGFGSGRHLLQRAEERPDVQFIGIEIHKPSIEQVLKQIEIKDLKNIDILDFDARHFFEMLPSNSVNRVFVHFPVPWDKKPHRRIFKESFLRESKRVLSVGGRLELRTDSENYFSSSLNLVLSEQELQMELFKNIPIDVVSKYEARWRKQDKNIYDIIIKNREDSQLAEPVVLGDFGSGEFSIQKIEERLGNTYRESEWFISFKRIFRVTDSAVVLELVMGSYNYPETVFLFISKKRVEYLIKGAIPIEINREIENYLRELL